MGNSSPSKEQSEVLVDNELPMKHSKLQKISFRKTEHREFIAASLTISNGKEYDIWAEGLAENPVAESTFALNPLKHSYAKAGMCGSSGTVSIEYENHPFLLAEEIKERSKEDPHKKFTEPELWFLLYGLADVTEKFHRKGEKAGDIRPENIFLSEAGNYKIATKQSWPAQLSSYDKRVSEDERTYLAPEEAEDIIVGRSKPEGLPESAESFSVGLTILHAALLANGDQLYEDKNKFELPILEAQRGALRNEPLYSDLFKFVVLSLTDPAPENRLTSGELSEWLKVNEEHILKMEPFGVNVLPLKVEAYAKAAIQNFDLATSAIGKLASELPNSNPEQEQAKDPNWQEVDEKIRKSQEMFPS